MLKIDIPTAPSSPTWRTLASFIREQVQTCLQRVLEEEVEELLGRGLDARFESRILPLCQRRTPDVAKLLPELYLHGLSSGDFTLALRGLLGDGAPLSASSVQRLTEDWQRDSAQWRRQDLSTLEPVYVWADGINVKAGLESTKTALLVLIAALADGTKVVLAVESGHRESAESWAEILRDLPARGFRAPACVVGDGALGLWNAVGWVWPHVAEQRCWNHTLRNVGDAVPLKHQPDVEAAVQTIAAAASVADAERERQRFPKACERLDRDWARMLTYYQFPKEHWRHLRTTNVVESPFAAVRLRTTAAKRFKKVERATAIIWHLLQVAEQRFRKLNAPDQCRDVYRGVRYADGVEVPVVSSTEKAAA
ncbi:IS256 family transposase [Gemmatimonas sp.]|uniref:IS256 family transposase n=1 Tax=Gemmatimonas sp. TaxID=1962908 RepID=UPI0025C61CA1|nr:IS256 family transposase [Gemmatimonas sp.]MCA2991967.1 IS256 family transposase [Gemmatimonas sp.]